MKSQIGFMLMIVIVGTIAETAEGYDDEFKKIVRQEICTLKFQADNKDLQNCTESRKEIARLQNKEAEANANASLFCRDFTYIVPRRNSGSFVIDHRLVGTDKWIKPFVNNKTKPRLGRLKPSEQYELRLHRIFPDGISKPEIIGPFQTLPLNPNSIMKVDKISMSDFVVDAEYPNRLKVEMTFNRTKELNCCYEAVLWGENNSILEFKFNANTELRLTLGNLEYGKSYTFHVQPIVDTGFESNNTAKTFKNFITPNRLNFSKNDSEALRTEHDLETTSDRNVRSNVTGGGGLTVYKPINMVLIFFFVSLLQIDF